MENEKIDPTLDRNIKIIAALFVVLVIVVSGWYLQNVMSVSALNISLADSTLTGNHSVLVMAANGTLLATGYSTETFDLGAIDDPSNTTFLIHLRPDNTNVFESPDTLLDEIVNQWNTNGVAIVVIGLLAGFLILRR